MRPTATDVCVRDRLLCAADRLFYAEGVQAVGIDRVLAEAGAAKASLYTHFRGKDDLIAAYTDRRAAEVRAQMLDFAATTPPAERAVRFFDWLVELVETPGYRGCPMQHVTSELHEPTHASHAIVAEQRVWIAACLAGWVRDAGVADAEQVARALHVLIDGAMTASELDGSHRAHDARWLARRLLTR